VTTAELSAILGRRPAVGGWCLWSARPRAGRGVAEQALLELALSRLTPPHHLARVVLLKQLYRALDLSGRRPVPSGRCRGLGYNPRPWRRAWRSESTRERSRSS
jgi:hypothetical protein